MATKKPRIGKSQVAGGVKVQLPLDSPLRKVLKTDQYDLVNIYTDRVDKTYVASSPDDNEDIEDDDDDTTPDEPIDTSDAPNLEDIVLIGTTGKRYSSGQTITDPEIYYDGNNNRLFRVTFEVKNSVGEIVKGVMIV
jgi:hypothetical protein